MLLDSKKTPLDLDLVSLKACFKQRCLSTNHVYQNWQIRVHRSLSWFKRARELPAEQADVVFMLLWVSLNSLYSRWDPERNAPGQDSSARDDFVRRVCEWDAPKIGFVLHQKRGLIKKILENFFLSNSFWRDPDNPNCKSWATEDVRYLDRKLRDHDYCRLLHQLMERLYVMRGQLMHGAATGGGRLNRKTLGHCVGLLEALVPVIIHVTTECGANDDWPDLCYPPLK